MSTEAFEWNDDLGDRHKSFAYLTMVQSDAMGKCELLHHVRLFHALYIIQSSSYQSYLISIISSMNHILSAFLNFLVRISILSRKPISKEQMCRNRPNACDIQHCFLHIICIIARTETVSFWLLELRSFMTFPLQCFNWRIIFQNRLVPQANFPAPTVCTRVSSWLDTTAPAFSTRTTCWERLYSSSTKTQS